jgi:electron transfer flavoprotein beta subunit
MDATRDVNILVIFNVENDLDEITDGEWEQIQNNQVNVGYARRVFNCFDESALETGLCIADSLKTNGSTVKLTALTITKNDDDVSGFIKQLYAVGFDDAVQIKLCVENLPFMTILQVRLIKRYIQEFVFDAILLGGQSSISDSKELPSLLAEELKLPCITHVTDLTVSDQGFQVIWQAEECIKRGRVVKPMVFGFGNSVHSYIRVATLREKMAVSKKNWTTLTSQDLGFSEKELSADSNEEPLRIYRQINKRQCLFMDGIDERQKAENLYNEYLKDMLIT